MSAAVNPIMTIAWRDFLLWAVRKPEAHAAFKADTGRDPAADAEHFAFWATSTQWGTEGVPPDFLAAMEAAGYPPSAPPGAAA